MPRGLFIVVEGGDGSGKSSVISAAADALRKAGSTVLTTREPGGTEAGLELRRLLLAKDSFDWTVTAELLLINAARAQHVEQVIRPALSGGQTVLCDRFVASTLAYQGAGRGIPENSILRLHEIAAANLWPDFTILLDVDPRIGLARSRSRLASGGIDETRFETLDLSFHDRVRKSFLDQAGSYPEGFAIVDAEKDIQSVQDSVNKHLRGLLRRQRG